MLKAFLWFLINADSRNVFCNDSASNKNLPRDLTSLQHAQEPSFIVSHSLPDSSVSNFLFFSRRISDKIT